MDLPSIERVREEAARSLSDMAREVVVRGNRNATHIAIEVRDHDGPVMKLKCAFEIDLLSQ